MASGDTDLLFPNNIEVWVETDETKRPIDRGVMTHVFTQQFSMPEKIRANLTEGGETDPFFKARETLLRLSHMLDDPRSSNRAVIHLDEPCEFMVVDVIPYKGVKAWRRVATYDEAEDPVIFMRYAHHVNNCDNDLESTSKAIHNMIQRSKPTDGEHIIYNIVCKSKQQMDILREYFADNSKMVSEQLTKKIEKAAGALLLGVPGSITSFLTPLYIPVAKKPKKENCKVCGSVASASCSRCKVARYCTKECQRNDWKEHKKECKTPESVATATGACGGEVKGDTQEPWIDVDPRKTPAPWNGAMNININNQASCGKDFIQMVDPASVIKVKPDKMMIVKVQFDLMRSKYSFSPLTIYSQGHKVDVYAVPQNMSGGEAGYIRLYNIVEYRGLSAPHVGRPYKVYLDAYVTKEGNVRVMLNKLHPMQPW